MKIHNVFIATLKADIQYCSDLTHTLYSSLGKGLKWKTIRSFLPHMIKLVNDIIT